MARITKPLTTLEIQKAKPTDKPYTLRDGNGLNLRVNPNSSKLWRFVYLRPFTKKRNEISLGKYPDLSLVEARAIRAEYCALLAQNIDPLTHRKEQAQAERQRLSGTFLKIAQEWKDKKAREVGPITLAQNWRKLELYLFPSLAQTPVAEISPIMAIQALKPLSKTDKSNALRRTICLLNEVLTFAVLSGVIPFNPCRDIRLCFSFSPNTHHPTIRPEELPELIDTIQRSRMMIHTRNALLFQLLTMTRPSETTGAEWSEIDLERGLWTIPPERMKKRKAHIIPLSRQALALLADMRQYSGRSRYIFKSPIHSNQSANRQAGNNALRNIGYRNKLTAHGLRAIASTYLNELGNISPDVIEACLSHEIGDQVRRAYNRSNYLEQRKPVMQLWADYVTKCGLLFK